MNMCAPMTVVDGFATAGIPDTWLMPFLLRATQRLDLAGRSLRSEVNLDGDRAFWRHTRPDPQRYETSQRLALKSPSGRSASGSTTTCCSWLKDWGVSRTSRRRRVR